MEINKNVKSVYTKIAFLFVLLVLSVAAAGTRWQAADDGLATFQKFVNGKIPIREAVVYRQLSNTNGTVLNREW
jgi:hypothetical protein